MLERRTAEAFVQLADTLVAGFDVIDFLHTLTERCVDLLDVDAAGILLVDQRGFLQLVAASTEQARLLELFQLQDEEGPCLDCYHSGTQVACADLATEPQRWPRFTAAAHDRGFAAVREQVLGAMNLFSASPGVLPEGTVAVAQALADVATIGILQERSHRESVLVTEQLQVALNSRVLIEQAKGVLAERAQISVAEAFTQLRGFARNRNRRLSEVAAAVIDGATDVAELVARRGPPVQ
jgi:hypothetical protein